MISWIPYELHTHTVNSDGSLTVLEMARKALELGFKGFALTDHNTISGQLEIPYVMKEIGINIIYGMEWTTFYGHMVALGIHEYVDWRDKSIYDIQKGIYEIHKMGGIAGAAHPYRIGSPMCTGCYWQFDIKDWSKVDYLEVWSEVYPQLNPTNYRSFRLWTDLLNKGHKITAVSGRDWHGDDRNKGIAVTYIGLEEGIDHEKCTLDAIKKGHVTVTLGPIMVLNAKFNSKEYIMGDSINLDDSMDKIEIDVSIDYTSREYMWKIDSEEIRIVFNSNKGNVLEVKVPYGEESVRTMVDVNELMWIRAELYGSMYGKNAMLAFTNPIYLSRVEKNLL